jgi:hypothetical protein
MKCRTQAALAVGAGYLLGRTHKTKLALGLAAMAATGKFGGVSGQLIKRGTKLIGSTDALGKLSPQLTEVTDLIRGDLVDAGKAAALTAVRGRIDRLSDRIQDQADAFREGNLPGAGDLPDGDDGDEKPRRRGGGATRRRRDEEEPADYEDAEDDDETVDEDESVRDEDEAESVRDEDEPEDEEPEDEEPEDEEPEDESVRDVRDEDEDEDEDEPEDDKPVRSKRRTAASGARRARSAAGSAPVRRTRR